MKLRILASLLSAAALLHRGPERAELRHLADELAALDRLVAAHPKSRR
jgi:hypothetical protein